MASAPSSKTLAYFLTAVIVIFPCKVLSDLHQLNCSASKQYTGEDGNMTCTFRLTGTVELSYWFRGKFNDSKAQICVCVPNGTCSLLNRRTKFHCAVNSTSVTLFVHNSTRSDEGQYLFEMTAHDGHHEKLVYYSVHEKSTDSVTSSVNGTQERFKENKKIGEGHTLAVIIPCSIVSAVIIVISLVILYRKCKRTKRVRRGLTDRKGSTGSYKQQNPEERYHLSSTG